MQAETEPQDGGGVPIEIVEVAQAPEIEAVGDVDGQRAEVLAVDLHRTRAVAPRDRPRVECKGLV